MTDRNDSIAPDAGKASPSVSLCVIVGISTSFWLGLGLLVAYCVH